MASKIQMLVDEAGIKPPNYVYKASCYETMMGSVAYGTSSDTSDMDVYGFCIPPKMVVFPHLDGEIPGFGRQHKRFDQYQQHHIELNNTVWDISIYNIVKYFNLVMENNPNMIDSLFTPHFCVLYINKVGQIVRENRKLFLHKGCWFKFKGYAYSQLHKARSKNPIRKRVEIREVYGWDVKFGMHVVRLLSECEQILIEGDIDLQRNREHLKAIRNGEVSLQEVERWFSDKEKQLEKLYAESKLQHSPDQDKIKTLLLQCMEEYWGSIDNCISRSGLEIQALRDIFEITRKFI